MVPCVRNSPSHIASSIDCYHSRGCGTPKKSSCCCVRQGVTWPLSATSLRWLQSRSLTAAAIGLLLCFESDLSSLRENRLFQTFRPTPCAADHGLCPARLLFAAGPRAALRRWTQGTYPRKSWERYVKITISSAGNS